MSEKVVDMLKAWKEMGSWVSSPACPEWFPFVAPEGLGHGGGGELGAPDSYIGEAGELATGDLTVVVGYLAQWDKPLRVVLLPLGDIVVVGAVSGGQGLFVVKAAVCAEDAVDYLGIDAVPLLVGLSQLVVGAA